MPPGTGWPGDPATPATPVARDRGAGTPPRRRAPTSPSSTPRSRSAAPARGWSRWREDVARDQAARRTPASPTGAGRSPAGAPPTPGVLVVGPRPGRARRATAPAGSSPATAPATGCSPRLHRVGLADPADLRRTPATASSWSTPGWSRRSAARRRRTSRPRPSATPARRGSTPSSPCSPARPGRRGARLVRLGRHAALVRRRSAGDVADARGRGSATAPRRTLAGAGARGHPARLLPPQPAEHLHRPAHRADARRRARPGRASLRDCRRWTGAPVSQPAEEAALKAAQSGFESQRGHSSRRCPFPPRIDDSLPASGRHLGTNNTGSGGGVRPYGRSETSRRSCPGCAP